MMKPEDFRQLINKIGIPIGLIGDDGPSDWSHGEVIKGTLTSYVVVERQDGWKKGWDTGAIITLIHPLTSVDSESKEFVGKYLLLLLRYPELAWDQKDPNVSVYGIQEIKITDNAPLNYDTWRSKAALLSTIAIMTIEDPLSPSEMAIVFQRRANKDIKD